jgi:hypothetical protein
MRDGERCRGRHGLVEKFPWICHTAVRLERWLDERPQVHCYARGRPARNGFRVRTALSAPVSRV